MKKKILITGAKGFIGKVLVEHCLKHGMTVIGVDLSEDKKLNKNTGAVPEEYTYFCADTRSEKIINIMPEELDAIIHLAGLSRDSDCKGKAYACFDANVMSTLNLINAAEKKKAKQFIFASTEWVYGEFKDGDIKNEDTPIEILKLNSEYALSKIVTEANLRQKYNQTTFPITILRFGIIYGPKEGNLGAVESIFQKIKDGEDLKVGSLKTGRRYIHVADIAEGIIKSIGLKGFHILNLEGERLITLKDVVETSQKILNKKANVLETSPDDYNIRNASDEKAKKVLNWTPKINMEEGLKSLNHSKE